MDKTRKVQGVLKSRPTMEGAGVHLKRAFGYNEVPLLDPFLLLDDFYSDNPNDYVAGFPSHPHRGIETVTYMLHGKIEHQDSMGNKGVIESGDIQWMTAGSGIVHSEMPKRSDLLWGFQLWVNLPASNKMMNPRYRGIISQQIPEANVDGAMVKVICGEVEGIKGPVKDIVVDSEYLDITVAPNAKFEHHVKQGHKVFAYVLEGKGHFDSDNLIGKEHVVIFDDGERINIQADDESLRFLLISGKPINEPVAWYGPIVMNTEDELEIAFDEYRKGTFIKS